MDFERTPKSGINNDDNSLSSLGRRHTPTARMSERKRNLFDKKYSSLALIIDDDADLGPMSPLQYSSSPTEDPAAHGVPFDRNAKQTDFTNLFPGAMKTSACVSPIHSLNSPLFSTEKPMLVLEESASSTIVSVQSGSGLVMPQLHLGSTSDLASIPEETQGKSRKTMQEKTPSERMINCQDLRVSFKKSLILGDMATTPSTTNHQKRSYSMSVLTEKNLHSSSTSPREKQQKLDQFIDASRARTSLTFEGVSIPTNRFYSAATTDENAEPVQTKKRYSLPNLHNKGRRSSCGGGSHTSSRRSKDNGVSRKGCSHNIKKPVRPVNKESLKKKVELAVLEDLSKEKATAVATVTADEAHANRISEIFKNIKNPLEMSRPLFFTDKPAHEDRFYISEDEEASAVDQEEVDRYVILGIIYSVDTEEPAN